MTLQARAAFALSTLLFTTTVFALGGFGVSGLPACAQGGTNRVVHLSWTAASGATSYSVYHPNNVLVAAGLSALDYDDTAAGTSNTYIIRAFNAAGAFIDSNTITVFVQSPGCEFPALAAGGYCDPASGSSAHLSWAALVGPNGYSIYRDSTLIASLPPSAPRVYDDHGAPAGSHDYRLQSFTQQGEVNLTFLGLPVPSCTSSPAVPANFTATATCVNAAPNVHLSWSDVADGSPYRVYRNGAFYNVTAAASYDDPGVTAGQTYTYFVQSVNKSGTAETAPQSVPVSASVCPPPPGDFGATAVAGCNNTTPRVVVSWSASSNAASYVVWRDGIPLSGSLPSNQTTYTDSAVASGEHHSYSVVATNASGTKTSPTTPLVDVSNCAPPPPAPALTAATFCNGSVSGVRLTWTASTGAQSYVVYRDGSAISQPLTALTYDDTSVTSKTYTYFVRVSNGTATSDSNSRTIGVPSDGCMPSAPASVSANAICKNNAPAVHVLWSIAAGASSYTILRNGASVGSTSNTSFDDTAVVRGQSYTYVVRSVNASGTADSNGVGASVSFDECLQPPGAFTLSATPFCDTNQQTPRGAIRLVWTTSTDAASYVVMRSGTQVTTTSNTTFVDTTAGLGTLIYTVRATNALASTDSNSVTVNNDPNICTNATAKPDLVVAGVAVQSSAAPGSSVRVFFTLLNQGDAAAQSTLARVQIGTGPELRSTDLTVASVDTPRLLPGASIALSALVTLPSSVTDGTWYFFVTADDPQILSESTRANNTSRSNAVKVQQGTSCTPACGATVVDSTLGNTAVMFTLAQPPCDGATVLWNFGDGGTSTAQTPTHTYANAGTYTWSVTVAGAGQSCDANGTITVVNPIPPRPRPMRH